MTDGWRQPIYRAHGPVEGEDWAAVTVAVNARMAERRVGQKVLSGRSGVSVATLRALQRGDATRRAKDTTLTAICRALDWPDDHLARVLLHRSSSEPASGAVVGPGADVAERLRVVEEALLDVLDRLSTLENATRP